jgi:hypothetical protein
MVTEITNRTDQAPIFLLSPFNEFVADLLLRGGEATCGLDIAMDCEVQPDQLNRKSIDHLINGDHRPDGISMDYISTLRPSDLPRIAAADRRISMLPWDFCEDNAKD